IGGHEHGLQFIKDEKSRYQIVSGSGAKSSYIKDGKNALFTSKMQGFVTLDLMDDRSVRIIYYEYKDQSVKEVFTYTVPYQPEGLTGKQYHIGNEYNLKQIEADSVTLRAHPDFDKRGKFHRKLFGENYRKEWAAETKLPVIRISEIGGGLTPIKRGGG